MRVFIAIVCALTGQPTLAICLLLWRILDCDCEGKS